MYRLNSSNGPGSRSHHERLRRRTLREIMDPFEQLPVGDAGGGEEDVVPCHQVVAGQLPPDVDRLLLRDLALLVVPRPEPTLDVAADAFECGGGDDGFRRTPGAEERVDASIGNCRHQRAGDVAVGD